MTKERIKTHIPYVGIPVLCAALLILQISRIDPFSILHGIMLIIFGYIATVSDIKTKKIANGLVLAMLAGWVITIVGRLFFDVDGTISMLISAALGFVVAGGVFLLVYVVSRKGLGGGDVKFMAVAGLYLGFYGVIPAMLYGTILAALTGIVLLIMKKIGRKDTMPLAPFLYVGILITIFF